MIMAEVKSWTIGGHYTHKDGTVLRLLEFSFHSPGVRVKAASRPNASFLVDKADLSGPTHIPCPVCGELQIVRETPHNQITLAEHLDRCHA